MIWDQDWYISQSWWPEIGSRYIGMVAKAWPFYSW